MKDKVPDREIRRFGAEPTQKRAIAFVDGQNLFHAIRLAFGQAWPN